MEKLETEEWVAEDNQAIQAKETPAIILTYDNQQTQEEDSDKQQPVLSNLIPPQTVHLEQIMCIEDSTIMLVGLIGRKLELPGKLKVTSQRLLFIPNNKPEEIAEPLLQIPVGYLSRCDRSVDDKTIYIELFLKYGCSLRLRCAQGKNQLSFKAHQIIGELIRTSTQLATDYGAIVKQQSRCKQAVFATLTKDCFQFDNQNLKRFPNYPEKFMVPLNYLSKNNSQERLVIFSFRYNAGKEEVTVWRTGPGKPDSFEEDWIAKSRMPNSRFFTLQIKNRGIGSGKSSACRMVELEGLAQIRDSFHNLYRITFNNHESLKWLGNLNQTRWLDQISALLQQASALVGRIISQQTMNVIILADSDVRGAQLVALAQILLFPEYRTIEGFSELVERQLLQWGYSRNNKRQQVDRGAAIVQFFDAVYQLTCIYPLSFEFGQGVLVFLAQNVYSNRFGNFLLATRAISSQDKDVVKRCWSVWACLKDWIADPIMAPLYLNPFYVDFKECDIYQLKQIPSAKHLRIWNGFFFKRLKQKNPDYHVYHRYQQIQCQHFQNKRNTELLRRQLSEQHKQLIERRQILKDLKALD